jgi:hypothetical protein
MKLKKTVYVIFSFSVLGFLLVAMKPVSNSQIQQSSVGNGNKTSFEYSPKTKSPKFRNNIGTGKKNSKSHYSKKTKKHYSKGIVTPKTKGNKAVGYKLNGQKRSNSVGINKPQNIVPEVHDGDNLKNGSGLSGQNNQDKNIKTKRKMPKFKSYRIK